MNCITTALTATNRTRRRRRAGLVLAVLLCAAPMTALAQPAATDAAAASDGKNAYVLGPDDTISIKALDAEEINTQSLRIDPNGAISLPLVGRLTASGLTVERLEQQIAERLQKYVRSPRVSVTVVDFRSQPVSVMGSVGQPGVHQLEGRKTLIEILARAGGVKPEAGSTIMITRRSEYGAIPLPGATTDASGVFSIATVNLQGILQATSPEQNILIKPQDVISVPKADIVYVIGEVKKPGGFALAERSSVSGVRALAMADGLTPTAAAHKAVIIRQSVGQEPIQIPVNLKEILSGKRQDVQVLPDDILFIPMNVAKNAFTKTLSTAIQAASSALIYHAY